MIGWCRTMDKVGDVERARVFLAAPRDAVEAAKILAECSRLRNNSRRLNTAVCESPWSLVTVCDRLGASALLRGRGVEKETGPSWSMYGCDVKPESVEVDGFAGAADSVSGGCDILVLITLERMCGVIEVSRGDLLAVVGGGAVFSGFEERLVEEGLYFPYRPEFYSARMCAAGIMMGGEAACTEGRYGGLREHVLSAELALPNGDIVRAGSRSIKDVAGYEILGLLKGAGGRCGVISQMALRLLPLPGSRVTFELAGGDEAVRSASSSIYRSMRPVFLKLFEGSSAAALGERLGVRVQDQPGRASGVNEPRALLVGELNAPGAGSESTLISEVGALCSGIGPVTELKYDEAEMIGRLHDIVFESREGAECIVHVSFDAPMIAGTEAGRRVGIVSEDHSDLVTVLKRMENEGAFVYRSLYPERVHLLVPHGKTGETAPPGCGHLQGLLGGDGELGNLLRRIAGRGLGEGVELIGRSVDGDIARNFVDPDLWKRLLNIDGGAGEAYSELEAAVYGAFDPYGIMVR